MKKTFLIFTFLILITASTFSEFIGEVDFNVGQTKDFDAYIVEDASVMDEQKVYWSTDDSSIATVDSNGLVTAKKKGRTFITATDNSGEVGKSVIIFVSVSTSIASIELEHSKVAMIVGDEIVPEYKLELMNDDIVEYNSNVKFRSMNENVVKVLNDKLLAVKAGEVRIYAYTDDGNKSDFVDIVVKDKYEEIRIVNLKNYQRLYVGEEFDIIVEDNNGNVIESGLTFSRGDRSIINNTGRIIVIASDGDDSTLSQLKVSTKSGKSDYKKLIYDNLVKAVEIDKNKATIKNIGEEITLEAKLIRKYEDKEPIWKDVIWTTSNSSIASVSNGVVKGIKTGTVRITATSKDGSFTDSCSVEVNPSAKGDYTIKSYIRDIDFEIPQETYTIGDKIPLIITYNPLDAEANTLKFKLSKGSSDQIFKEDGVYYFKPKFEGNYKITVETESEIKRYVNVKVKNNLKSIAMKLKLDLEKNRRYTVYYGETNEVEVEFVPIVESLGISDKEYTLETTNSKVSFENKTDDKFTFKAKSLGMDSITIESKYSGKRHKIDILVEPLIEKITVDQNSTIDIGSKFSPTINYKIFDNNHGYSKPLDEKFKLSIVSSNIPVGYIMNEIQYEKNAIYDLKKLIEEDHGKRDVLGDEISKRLIRKSHFEQSLQKVVSGYYRFTSSTLLTDRSGSKIKVASVSGENIIALFEGFVDYKVVTNDNDKYTTGRVSFASRASDFVVTSSNEIISSSEKNLSDEIRKKNETELLKKIKDRFGNSSGFDIPSEDLIVSILELESKIDLDEGLKHTYNRYVSREDAYKLIINIITSKTDYKSKKSYSSVFLDDNSGVANEAYNLGLISLSRDRKAEPYKLLLFDEFQRLLLRLERVIEIKLAEDVLEANEVKDIIGYKFENDSLIGKFKVSDKVTLEELIVIYNKILRE